MAFTIIAPNGAFAEEVNASRGAGDFARVAAVRPTSLLLLCLAGCGARSELEVRTTDASLRDVAGAPDVPAPATPRVVFTLLDSLGDARIHELRADGTGLRALSLSRPRTIHPTFTRDGRFMLYVALGDGDGAPMSLVALDLRARTTRTLVTAPRLSTHAVSPDGRTVVYAADVNLRAIGWDGAGDRLLVAGPYVVGSYRWGYGAPTFGGDSQSVFFATSGRVERIRLDGTRREIVLTEDARRIIFPNPTASPDGTRLALAAACDDGPRLRTWAIAALPASCATGAVVTAVERSEVGNLSNNPAWGAHGEIVYQQGRDLYVVDARGGAPRNLTATVTTAMGPNVSVAFPAWVPEGAALP